MLKTSVGSLIAGASTLCVLQLLGAGPVWAQTLVPTVLEPELSVTSLLPLEPETVAVGEVEIDVAVHRRIADNINARFVDDQTSAAESADLTLSEIPIIGEFLDEDGNFDWGMDLPLSVNLGDVMGDYGLIVGADFAMN